MLFEDVIQAIKPFGLYQKRLYFLISLIGIPASLHTMVTVFILATPDHRCSVAGLENDTYERQSDWHAELVQHAIPWDTKAQAYSSCLYYIHRNATHYSDNNETAECSRWVYSKEIYEETVITTLNLVCRDKDLVALANSILMGGLLGGSFIMGTLSDIIGRKKTMMIGLMGQFAVAIATSFVRSYAAFVALRFLTMFFGMGFFLAAFVAGMELVGPAQRTIAGIVIEMVWAVGLFLILLLAYLIRHWMYLQIAVSCFNLLFLGHFFWLPESARWLASKGRLEEASAIVRKAAQVNEAEVSEKVLALRDLQGDGPQEKVWRLFTTPELLVRSFIIFFNWCVVSMTYYGLGLNVGSLSGNLFLNFLYANIAESLSYVFCLVFLYRVGRRVLYCFTLFLGGGACIGIILPVLYGGQDLQWVTVTLSMIGKFGVSAAFAIVFIFSAELFPTLVRNSGIGVSSFCARIGGIASPYVAALGHYVSGNFSSALPSLVFGGLSVAAALLALSLPETLNKKLPESVEDAIHFGKDDQKKKNVYILEKPPEKDKGTDDEYKETYTQF